MQDIITGAYNDYNMWFDNKQYNSYNTYKYSNCVMYGRRQNPDNTAKIYMLKTIMYNTTYGAVEKIDGGISLYRRIYLAVIGKDYYNIFGILVQIINDKVDLAIIKNSEYKQILNNFYVII